MRGEGGFALFLIFPVMYSTGPLGVIAFLLIFSGFLLLFISPFLSGAPPATFDDVPPSEIPGRIGEDEHEVERELHYGGVIFIGPVPIVFGSDKNYALYAIIAGFLMLFSLLIFLFLL